MPKQRRKDKKSKQPYCVDLDPVWEVDGEHGAWQFQAASIEEAVSSYRRLWSGINDRFPVVRSVKQIARPLRVVVPGEE